MKILYHHRTRSKDGQFVHIEELSNALRRRGHEVVLVGPVAVDREEFGSNAGLVAVLKRYLPKAAYEIMEFAYSWIAYRRLTKAYLLHRPDCVYERYNLFMPAGVRLKRKYNLPMLLEVNSPLAEERARVDGLALRKLANWTERTTWQGANYVLPATQALAPYIRKAGVPDERIKVIRNAVNLERFNVIENTVAAKKRLNLDDRLVLGFTGFVREWHRMDRVIDFIAESDPDLRVHLHLVGDGPARPELVAQAHRRNVADRLTVTGVVPRDQVAKHVAAFDVALNLDVVPYALALKLFEYLAMGRAIIAHDWPNIREILTDRQNAILFDPDIPGAFHAALDHLCRDESLRQRLGENARQTIDEKRLTWDANAERVEELCQSLINESTAHSR